MRRLKDVIDFFNIENKLVHIRIKEDNHEFTNIYIPNCIKPCMIEEWESIQSRFVDCVKIDTDEILIFIPLMQEVSTGFSKKTLYALVERNKTHWHESGKEYHYTIYRKEEYVAGFIYPTFSRVETDIKESEILNICEIEHEKTVEVRVDIL